MREESGNKFSFSTGTSEPGQCGVLAVHGWISTGYIQSRAGTKPFYASPKQKKPHIRMWLWMKGGGVNHFQRCMMQASRPEGHSRHRVTRAARLRRHTLRATSATRLVFPQWKNNLAPPEPRRLGSARPTAQRGFTTERVKCVHLKPMHADASKQVFLLFKQTKATL